MSITAKQVCLITALIALIIYFYGILVTITSVEKNECKMTYMFEYPQFVKIHFRENEKFPKYNLFAYSEGRLTEAARNMQFNGAPVIFVPGNAGSYKQARSFASVALRKGIEQNWLKHLDYFTVDYDEEYSALFGGVLDDQSIYLELCIKAVLNLYKDLPNPPTSVSIVAHSMGGKVAQSVLMNRETAKLVNTVIAIASPIDKPVVNIDFYMEAFYRKSNKIWLDHRAPNPNAINNLTSTCCNASNFIEFDSSTIESSEISANQSKRYFLNDILFITVGGGSRDILVPSGLTTSQFSDIHVMSSCMPGVWLTTDHLASVWCLQQVLVINRFLYSIILPVSHRHRTHDNVFVSDKSIRLSNAKHYLTQETIRPKNKHDVNLIKNIDQIGEWVEDNRRVFFQQFQSGLNQTYIQMIPLNRFEHYQILNVEAINVDIDDWVFGCSAVEIHEHQRYCSIGHSLTHYVKKLPSKRHSRRVLKLDLHKIQDDHPEWTHIILTLLPTKEPLQINVDIHAVAERQLTYEMPSWYSYQTHQITDRTMLGAVGYRINFPGLDESYQSVQLHIQAHCQKPKYHIVAKVCVPWTRGFERYHYFTEELQTPFYVHTPITRPAGYNTTLFPLSVDLHLDPNCYYTISATNSFGQTASRIFLEFSHWLPAHIVAILLLAFKYQIKITPDKEIFKCSSLNSAMLAGQTFFIITASRLAVHVIKWSKTLPDPDQFKHSVVISVIIHGAALATLNLITYGLWVSIALCGNVAHQFLFKLTQWPISSGLVLPAIQKFPITVGFVLVSMACGSCGGLALICAVLMYFIILSKMYEDYLEEFVFKTAALITEKLFGKKLTTEPNTQNNVNITTPALTGQETAQEKQLNDKSNKNDKNTATKEESTSENDAKKSHENESESKKVQNDETKDKKKLKKQKGKKVEFVKTSDDDKTKTQSSDEPSTSTEPLLPKSKSDLDIKEGAVVASSSQESFEVLYNQLDPSDVALFSRQNEPEELTEEERKEMEKSEEELEKLISQMVERQKVEEDKRNKEMKIARAEYDDVPDGLSAINFHMTLFLLLCVLALLNIPSVLVWARNYKYGEKILQHDPSYFPAIASIASLSVIWQLPTPRNVHGYEPMSSLCYVMAIIAVLYCQDSLYRLNAIISSMFIIIALQQLFMPKLLVKNEPKDENVIDVDLLERVRRLREDMSTSELKAPPLNKEPSSLPAGQ
ncbi:GPI inositol-deacylase [Contarinia nasturtii]|uniref:GPI inositol-deacylase n=1 Tax=Contarinia nasturtii TaxID=265458 RepID=UPI0012D3E62C|nr:GPI inositol-deacylase [Contarinia nasturtii]